MKLVPDARLSPDTLNVAVSDSGLTLRHHDSKYWMEFSFDGNKYFTEAKYLMLTLSDLKETLNTPITVYRVTGRDEHEVVWDYNLAEESRDLLVKGWRHALVDSNRTFLKSIAKVSLVSFGALSAVVFAGEASMALPLTFLLAGGICATWAYHMLISELPKGFQIAAAFRNGAQEKSPESLNG